MSGTELSLHGSAGGTELRRHAVEFTGDGREYFRIWVVNLALSVGTLGIYSAWAKVRRLQYFYRHTRIGGASLDFHGRPEAILRGRIVAVALFAIYTVSDWAGATTSWIVLGLLAAVFPFLLCRSFRFRLSQTSYRGLRFSFAGSTLGAYGVFLAMPVLSVLSVLTLVPLTHHQIRRYQHANTRYGRSAFSFDARPGHFYLIYLGYAGLVVGFAIALVGLTFVAMLAVRGLDGFTGSNPRLDLFMALPITAVSMTGVVAIQAFLMTRIRNLVWSHTSLDGHRFLCDLEFVPVFRLLWVNLFATLLTVGLFRPFAKVRLARHLASAITLSSMVSLDAFAAGDTQAAVTAAGEEAAEFFDLDIAF